MDLTRIRQKEISGLDSSEMMFLECLFSNDDDRIFDQFTGLSDENMKELNNGNHDETLIAVKILHKSLQWLLKW